MSATQMAAAPGSTREPEIIATLKTIISEMSGIRPSDIDVDATFIEMGAESLLMLQASQAITEKIGVKVPFRALMEEYPTVRSLATYIDQKLPRADPAPVVQPAPAPEPPAVIQPEEQVAAPPVVKTPIVSNGSIEQIMAQQLQIMAQQLEVMRTRQSRVPAAPVVAQQAMPAGNGNLPKAETKTEEQPFVPFRSINKTITSSLTEQQQRYLDALIERVSKRTQKSKQLTQKYRPYFADSREVAGFRSLWKELLYLIIVEQAIGSKIWDVDGNEYLDITMGFGSLLFGHSPEFVIDALQEQVANGMQLGPQSHLAGKVAKLICELTGVERATFCNSGTEAVMTALRLARTVTGRTKIVMFTGSFHGTFDGVLVRAERGADGTLRAVPMAPGVPPSIIQDVMILNYGAPESLQIVQQHAHELAGVLVEPLQSRRPDNRPSEFLQGLRRITQESGAAFIFDEVVSGFRMHPGGAQALFNIKADLVTYGKAAGAGMPIGIIGGKKAYMDAIDGGMWQYGDTSYPRADTTFFVGTFFKHPMVMAAAWAALNHIKNSGPQLQERLNEKTAYMALTLNEYFEHEEVPLRIVHCGSLFRFHHTSDQKYMDLFFYQLLEKGIYVWEGRNCFISTAHTDEDIEFLISKVKETAVEMRAGGFLGNAPIAKQENGHESTAQQLPLTEGQKQLWSVAQLGEQASRAYNESFSMHLHGPLNLSALRSAIQQLVDRHDALRITISRDGEQQLIASSMPVDVSVVELSPQTAIAAWQSEQAQTPFNFVEGPLFRANVLRVSPDYHVLAMTVHHLIIDGWSFGVLLRELSALYEAECQGVSASLPAAKQFSEYVEWQSQQQRGPEMDPAEAYWLAQFADSIPILELPTDHPRPAVQTYNGSRAHLTIDSSLCRELKQASAREQVTLFQTLLAGYKVLLHRLTNQDDIVVGIASAGQASVTGDDLIGYCINLLPLRSRVDDDPTFTEYLRRLKRVLSDAADNQIYSLPNLIKKLGLTRDPSRAPLVTVTFNLDRGSSHLKFFDLEAEVVWNSAESSKFDLFLNITEQDSELVLDMDYNSDLFEASTIHRWLCHLRTLLEGIVAQPQRKLSELPLLDQQEQRQQLVEWNQTANQYPRLSVSELFEAQVESTPDNVAVTFQNEKITYRELNERANQLAHYLRGQGVGVETLVGVLMERSVEMVVALVGILKAGGAYVPLDPGYPRERLQLMLEDARPRVLLTQPHLVSTLPETEAEVLYVGERGRAPLPDLFMSQAREPQQRTSQEEGLAPAAENLAYVIYTSGSTGTPKGISITQSAINRLVCNTNYIDLGTGDVIAQISNFSFDAFTFEIWGALLHGAELSILTNDVTLSPLDFAAEIKSRGITTMFLTTALFNVLAREAPSTFKTLKNLLTGGEMADSQSFQRVVQAGPPARLLHVYGPTENTTFSTWHLVHDAPMTVPIGRAISNTELYVLDRNYEPAPVGVPGELLIGGAGLARAYLNRPDLTAETFIPHRFSSTPGARLYRTGDLVRYLPDGNLEFLGRLDQQVKVRGFRIELAEIEAVLCRHAAVHEAIVVAHNDGRNQEKRLIAYVVGNVEAAASELRNYLKEYLPEYMIPAAFVLLEKLPLTSNGKVDRKRLPEPETSRPELNESYAAPRTEAERVLARIWSEVLRVQQVGIHDNFFELGGDSILNVQIITRARQRGLHLTAKQVFYHQTVAELAAVAGSTPEIKATQDEVAGAVELTPVQHWFFAQELTEPAHFNMAVMVAMSADINVAALKGAVAAVIRHHDALRSRYEKQDDGSWRQWCVPLDEQDLPFVEMDLSIAPTIAVRPAIEAASAQWHRHLNLEYGPVLRAVYFKVGAERGARLLLVVHHLVVDVISWRILLEDLQTAYQQLASGKAVELRAKSSSYQQWAAQLRAYASSAALQEEVTYWTDERRQRVRPIRLDQKGSNLEHATRYVTNNPSAELTEALLREVPRAYNTQISEVLLAALSGAYYTWSGERLLSVDVEGHGREALFDDVDLTRTVGWFTSIYPLLLELPHGSDYGKRLTSIKEQVRRVKNGGVGYGVLRYLSADKALRRQLAEQPQSQISFNYLGRYDQAVSEVKAAGVFHEATERTGANRALNGERQYPLQLNSSVVNGSLQMSWEYSADMHREQTVTQLAAAYLNELEQIIRHCQNTNAGGFTPSDVADFKWSETDLEDLSAAIKKAQGA